MHAVELAPPLVGGGLELDPQRGHLADEHLHRVLEVEHADGAGQVEAELARQRADLAQALHVAVGVAARAAGRAPRPYEALRLVRAEGLRMHPGQLGRDRDRVAGVVVRCPHDHPAAFSVNNLWRGSPWLACWISCRRSSASRSCFDSFEGTAMRSRASRSPWPPPFRRGAPRPLTRSVFPSVAPDGILTRTVVPSGVGSSTCSPIAASANVTGTSMTRSSPLRVKSGLVVTRVTTKRSPGSPPRGAASPFPFTLMRVPSRTPAGIRTW